MVLTSALSCLEGGSTRASKLMGRNIKCPEKGLKMGVGGSALSWATDLVNSPQLCSWVFCVLVWASHIAHTCFMPGSKPALLTWGGWVRGLREQKQQWEGHFSCPSRRDTRSVSEQWSVAWMGAANGVEGPGHLGPHREVWFLRL